MPQHIPIIDDLTVVAPLEIKHLLAAGNDVSLRPLLGNKHGIHDLTYISGENYILDTCICKLYEEGFFLCC